MKQTIDHAIPICNAFDVLSKSASENEFDSSNDQTIAPSVETEVDIIPSGDADSSISSSFTPLPTVSNGTDDTHSTDFVFRSKGLHMANLNVRHLLPKLDELRISMACENGPDVLGICETFLNDDISCNQLTVNGFDHIRKDRSVTQDKSGGGLILYFRNNINCKHRPEFEISNIETIWAEITMPKSKPFLICTAYRPPNATASWIDLLEEELSAAQTSGFEIILMGDINIDFQVSSNNKWLHLIQLLDLTQMVTDYTRITSTTATIIDHIYSSNPENIVECFVPSYAISDHFPVCITRKINHRIAKTEHMTTSYRCFKRFNETLFLSDLGSDLESFTLSNSNVDDDLTSWFSIIQKQLDKHAPIKTRRVKSQRLPEWCTPEIVAARRTRDSFKKDKNWSQYKKFRNKTQNLIRKAKRNHFSESIATQKDTKTIWKHFRSYTKKTDSTLKTLPDELKINDETYSDSQNIASKLNEYFASVCDHFSSHSDPVDAPDMKKLDDYVSRKVPSHIHFTVPYITTQQVVEFIHGLNPTKATGIDGLGPRILKMAAGVLSPSITSLINKSIDSSCFPSQLKIAKIFPIHKSGPKSDPSNYRPISILPTISKLFEKHINKHLMGFLNKYNLIHENQSGFRPKHSCQTALIKLVDQWMTCIDNGDIVGTLFIDFRKAFDLVDHSILLDKLSHYKFSDSTFKLFASYIQNRYQVMDSGKELTRPANIKSGVPQGSILGPSLFLIFINDLHLYIEHCDSDYYADDATVHTRGKTKSDVETKLQHDGNRSKQWGKQNKMNVHYDKTSCMLLGTRHSTQNSQEMNIYIDGNKIKNVTKQKLLGIYIDENLQWSDHIDYLCSTISSKISLLKQLSLYIPVEAQKLYYQGYILPLIDYGSSTWGTTSKTNIERISKLQKRAARIILNAPFDTASAEMFNTLGWQTVTQRHNYNKAVLVYKALNDLTPSYISDLLTPVSQLHHRTLRSMTNGSLAVPRSKKAIYDGSFSSSAPRLWNDLPETVKKSSSLKDFKRSVKEHI